MSLTATRVICWPASSRRQGISGGDRRLVNVVAQHSIDMWLLRNMRDEHLVFVERRPVYGR